MGSNFPASINPRSFIYGKMVYSVYKFTLSTINGFPAFNVNKPI